MKRNTKTLVIFLVIAVMAMFTVVSMASAEGDKVYAGGTRASCIVTNSTDGPNGTGFDNNFKLITGATWWTTTESTESVVTFHKDGTISRQFHSVSLNANPANTNATASESTASPTSGRVHPGESFTVSYGLSGTLSSGLTFTINKITIDGYYSEDGMTIASFTPAPEVETQQIFSSGVLVATYHRICTRAATLVKIKETKEKEGDFHK